MLAPNQIIRRATIDSDGAVEGYASLFHEVDSTRDMVMPGAFAQTLRTRGLRRIPMLFQHDPAEPIGVWLDLYEDARGLRARGRLIADVARARSGERAGRSSGAARGGNDTGSRRARLAHDCERGRSAPQLFRAASERVAMAYSFEDMVAHERRRWMRPDVHLFVRPDAQGFANSDAARWREQLLHPDHKLWNFHVSTNARRRSPAEQAVKGGQGFVAELARLQTRQDSLRRAFVELKQLRQRQRALRRAEATRLKRRYDAAWDRFIAAFHHYWGTCRKAGFDPEQPRDERGKWTNSGSSDRPNIPKERPPTARLRNRVIKEVAKWLAKAAAREVVGPVGTLLNIAEAGSWLYEAYPYVRAYLDEPKTLDELQRAARTSEAGYNIHHIVEQTPAEQDGYPSR